MRPASHGPVTVEPSTAVKTPHAPLTAHVPCARTARIDPTAGNAVTDPPG